MHNNRYILSFTAAGLALSESIKIAEVYLSCKNWEETKSLILEENLPVKGSEERIFPQELVTLKEIESDYIRQVIKASKGNKTQTCNILKISRPTLDKKIKEYQIKI